MSEYDLNAMIREYAEAKIDFDDNALLDEDSAAWRRKHNRLVAIEQLLIHVSGVKR